MDITDKIDKFLVEGIEDVGIFKAAFMAGHPGCFDENTEVRTKDGYKPIKEIKQGDIVFTFNEKNKIEELKEVEEVMEYENYSVNMMELEFENGERVICTEDHEFYVDGNWVKAKDL